MVKTRPIYRARTIRLFFTFVLSLSLVLSSCVSAPVKSPTLNTKVSDEKTLGLLIKTQPGTGLAMPGAGVGGSVGRGAAFGAVGGANVGIHCNYTIICIPVFGIVGALGGSVFGALASESSEKWEKAESLFQTKMAELKFNDLLAENLQASAKEYGYTLKRLGALSPMESASDANNPEGEIPYTLELSDVVVHLQPSDMSPVNSVLQLVGFARSRIVQSPGGILLDERTIKDEETEQFDLDAWMADDGLKFQTDVRLTAKRMSEIILTELLSFHPEPERLLFRGSLYDLYYKGVAAINPSMNNWRRRGQATSLQPRLEWNPFRAENVAYDIKVLQNGQPVYRRDNIRETYHTIETPLEPRRYYLWTIRAKYEVNGQKRTTQWTSLVLRPSSATMAISMGSLYFYPPVSAGYYNFITPSK